MPHVVLLTTGGTISSRRAASGAVVATDDAAALGKGLSWPAQITVEAHDLMRIGSYQMTFAHLRQIADAVAEHLSRDDVDGIVITHGTDTLEETALLLDLCHDDPRPVVLTGAQRAADVADTDGPRNLTDAVALAASPEARDHGVLVSFAGAVLAARGTRKTHTLASSAFGHPSGPLGTVDAAGVRLDALPHRTKPLPRPGPALDQQRVDIVMAYPGGDDTLVRASVAAGARGIILAGTGLGNAPAGLDDSVRELTAAGIVVGLSTRVGEGPVRPVYGNGGGADLVSSGAVPISHLPASQARVLLAVLLALDLEPAAIRRHLATSY